MVSGLSHITLIVKDLERTGRLFKELFDAKELYASGDSTFSLSREKFFSVCGLWFCIMEGEPLPTQTYNHIAFQIPEEAFLQCAVKIRQLGLQEKPDRPRVDGEARSLYFYDYDNHLFELHTGNLAERLKRYSQGNHPTE